MSADGDLKRRLFRELGRGADAELHEVLSELGVLAEPPPEVDAQILAAVAGASRPSERADEAVLAAAGAAASTRRPRRALRLAVMTVAVAAGLVAAFAVGRLAQPVPVRADDEVAAAALELARDVLAREGPEAAARVLAATASGRAPRPPGADGPAVRPDEVALVAVSAADSDHLAASTLALADRVRATGDPHLQPALETMLLRTRERCPDRSRCQANLSLRLAEWALADHRPDDVARYAADAAATDDEEIKRRAIELSLKPGR